MFVLRPTKSTGINVSFTISGLFSLIPYIRPNAESPSTVRLPKILADKNIISVEARLAFLKSGFSNPKRAGPS